MMRVGLLVMTVAVVVVFVPGCNIAAPIYYLLHGPARTPAVYDLADRPTVVFVDDRSNTIAHNAASMRRLIAATVSTELMRKNLLTVTIRPQDALAMSRQHDRFKDVMPVDAIGEAVGAEPRTI